VALGPASAPAHPHVYVVYSVVLPAGPTVEAIGLVFTFDEPFSAMIRTAAAWGGAARAAASHAQILRQLPHEIEITYDGAPVALEPPTGLEVGRDGERVVYRFRVPLRRPLRAPGTLEVRVDDPGFYTAFALQAPDPVEVHGPGAVTCARATTPGGAPGPLRCTYAAGS
jgi:ABC-type uncharacterized transport system substrate-binding protein